MKRNPYEKPLAEVFVLSYESLVLYVTGRQLETIEDDGEFELE